MIINCITCNSEFEIQRKRYNERTKQGQKGFTCSKTCLSKYRDIKYRETSKCEICNTEFLRSKAEKRKRKFCSQKCANTYAQKFTNPKNTSASLKRFYASEEGKLCIKQFQEKIRKYKNCPYCNTRFYGCSKYCSCHCSKISHRNNISKTRKKMFAEGRLNVTGGTTTWYSYKGIRIQGSYEQRVCVLLDKLKETHKIQDWSRSKLRIKYIGEDKLFHSYLVDFEIITRSGRIILIEVKGYVQQRDFLKWKATKQQGHNLIVLMEKHINRIEKKILI